MSPDTVRTDLVILGGGFMGLSLAYQATSRGIRSIVLEPAGKRQTHYMTGLLAPRADYLSVDRDEVKATVFECLRWRKIFSDVIQPKLYIMPFGTDTPLGPYLIGPLMEIYDRLTGFRFGDFSGKSFRINNATLEQTEQNLKKNYFQEAIGFYELTAPPDSLLIGLGNMAEATGLSSIINYSSIRYYFKGSSIRSVLIGCPNGERFLLTNTKGLKVINAAGPYMQDVAEPLGIYLPVEYRLGFQISVSEKYCFQHSIITFGADGRYTIISQHKDHIQVGPTNTFSESSSDVNDINLRQQAKVYMMEILTHILEPGIRLPEPEIKSGGLRVKLKLPFVPDSNRPFIMNTGFDNYHVIYPGKAVLALKTADEFLAKQFDGKRYFYCLDGRKEYRNMLKLNIIRLKSLVLLGLGFAKELMRKYFL